MCSLQMRRGIDRSRSYSLCHSKGAMAASVFFVEFVWVLSSTAEDILLGRRGSFVVWNRNKVWRTISLRIF